MWKKRIPIVFFWSFSSALCAGCLVYLGANTQPYQEKWPLAAFTGAAIGTVAALVILQIWGTRKGILIVGLGFAFLQAVISCPMLWGLK
jgi:hypothetical protein